MYKCLSSPIRVDLEVTGKCNLRCSHCYNFWRPNDSVPPVELSKLKRILLELRDNGIMEITITGGEPLLNPMAIFEILEFCRKAAISVSFNSNLTLIDDEIALKISKYKPAVMTTIFSHDEIMHDNITGFKGSHKRTINGILKLHQYGVLVAVNMVVSQKNISEVFTTGCFVRDLGVRSFTAVRTSPPIYCDDPSEYIITRDQVINTLDQLVRLHDELKLNVGNQNCYPLCMIDDWRPYECLNLRNCSAGVFCCAIGADGNVRPCVQGNLTLGNIFDEPLKTIWMRMEAWRDGSNLPNQCKKCEHLTRCTGGCRSDSLINRGKINSPDIYSRKINGKKIIPPKSESESCELDINDHIFVPRLKFRKENDGVIVALFHRQSRQVFVSSFTANVLEKIQEKHIVIKNLISEFDLDEVSTLKFMSKLASLWIIRKN